MYFHCVFNAFLIYLSANVSSSANVFFFGDFNTHHKYCLTNSGGVFLSSDPSIYSAGTFPPLGNSALVTGSVKNKKLGAWSQSTSFCIKVCSFSFFRVENRDFSCYINYQFLCNFHNKYSAQY